MKKAKYISIFLIISFFLSSANCEGIEPQDPFFYLNLLSPYTCCANPALYGWALLMEEELPKIGIGIDINKLTGWGSIYSRTWEYPVGEQGYHDYIPTYEEGGFDIFFVGWSWGLDWDPTGLFDTASIVPAGYNMYQYSNPVYDSVLLQYTSELDVDARIPLAKQLQQILHEDLPTITLIYRRSLFGFSETLEGYDKLLIATSSLRAENWDDTDDHIVKYALPVELSEYNTFVQESYYDAQWMAAVYGSLYARAQDTRFMEPMIADSMPTVSEDSLQFNVTIDAVAKFSNGDPVLAEDVKYTYELHMTPSVASSAYVYLTSFFESNDSIVVIDDTTIQFNLKQPYFLATSLFSYQIIDKSLVEPLFIAQGANLFNLKPIETVGGTALVTSCGPFILSEYSTVTSTATLVPNPYWHGITPALTQLIFTWIAGKDSAIAELAAGTVDIVDSRYSPVPDDYADVVGVDAILVKVPCTQEMALNLKNPVFGTGELTPLGTAEAAKNIRKAISHSVPRENISEILGGLVAPASNPMPDASVGFDDTLEPYAYDINLALSYMELAGYHVTSSTTTTTTTNKVPVGNHTILLISVLALTSVLTIRRRKQ